MRSVYESVDAKSLFWGFTSKNVGKRMLGSNGLRKDVFVKEYDADRIFPYCEVHSKIKKLQLQTHDKFWNELEISFVKRLKVFEMVYEGRI